jgi:hypothetical protein
VSPNGAPASPVSRQVDEPLVPLLEEAETVNGAAEETPELLEIEDSVAAAKKSDIKW